MDPREYDWQMGDLAADPYMGPDERYNQPPPRDAAWPQQFLPSPGDTAKWQAPPTALARWPVDPSQMSANEAAAFQTQSRYRNPLTRDPASNQMGELAQMIAPQSPLDYALLASGPVAKAASVPVRAALYGGAMALDPGKAEATLLGKTSKTADLALYKKAEEMLLGGRKGPEIRKETNWFPIDTRGNLAYEISDKGTGWVPGQDPSKIPMSAFAGGRTMTAPAGGIYNHPELYEAHPELKDIPVVLNRNLGKGVRGGFDPPEYVGDQPKVHITPASSGQMRSVLSHELFGHGVQDLNQGQTPSGQLTGWSIGGNPNLILKNMKEGTPQWEVYQQLLADAKSPLSFERYSDMLKGSGLPANEKLYKNLEHSIELHGVTPSIDDFLRRLAAHKTYRAGSGEEMARAIQARMNFGPKKIQEVPFEQSFETPLEQQIFIPRPALKPASERPGYIPDIPDPERFGMMGSLADQGNVQLSAKAPTGFVPGSILEPKTAEPYDFLTGRRPNAPYPQFAERYPETGPPTMVPRDKGPGLRPEKTLTPEAEGVAKARDKIIKEMRSEGYQPFFDPSQRFPAEFQKQPGPHADTAGALAKKQKTIDEHLKTIDTPETRQALRDAYSKGLDLPDSQAWYYLGQVEKKMKQDLGEEAGAKRFRDHIATAMSATTTGMNPQQNLIMSQYLNYLRAKGLPVPTEAHQTPVSVGGQRTMPNIKAYQEIFGGQAGPYETLQAQAFKNPKRADFAQAQMGNPRAFTVDEQMAHGMIGEDVPKKGTYGLITNIGREEAGKAGVDPQRYQDVSWAGFKKMLEDAERAKKGKEPLGPGAGYQGKPMISEINDQIERTHRLTGMPRQEIWERGYLKSEIPLYTTGGLAVMGGLASQNDYRQ